ncbi:unnamed protein product [Cochlearia groenlandica]
MASLSLALGHIIILTFFVLLNSKETLSSRLARSMSKLAEIGADDYPSSGRNSPVHDLGFPQFPPFQEDVIPPPPPPPDLPLFPPPPAFPSPDDRPTVTVTVPAWPSLPDFPPFPFLDQPPPSEPFGPRFDESDDNWMPSTPNNP